MVSLIYNYTGITSSSNHTHTVTQRQQPPFMLANLTCYFFFFWMGVGAGRNIIASGPSLKLMQLTTVPWTKSSTHFRTKGVLAATILFLLLLWMLYFFVFILLLLLKQIQNLDPQSHYNNKFHPRPGSQAHATRGDNYRYTKQCQVHVIMCMCKCACMLLCVHCSCVRMCV